MYKHMLVAIDGTDIDRAPVRQDADLALSARLTLLRTRRAQRVSRFCTHGIQPRFTRRHFMPQRKTYPAEF